MRTDNVSSNEIEASGTRAESHYAARTSCTPMLALILGLFMLIFSSRASVSTAGEDATVLTGETRPVAELLNRDGTLNLTTGYNGALDVAGFEMTTDADGSPRFVPSETKTTTSPPARLLTADPNDRLWDDDFALPDTGAVHALVVIGTDLYAGGNFTSIGGVAAKNIAKWDGTSWSALSAGTNRVVLALAAIGTDLYVGGLFRNAGDVPANYIAKWNGTSWSALGTGTNGSVEALAAIGTDLYAGGYFRERILSRIG